ncbi:aldo/keto reductase [Caloramator sp. Dgby_cultured_2]|uniref:aldo/keto reductase n=1 Tax=Caloramator sp. Dgby_cultured_2 TaxID=3029174 RepID=UPI00237D4DAF|nr:aldo/keto reductase [Caloramator sp. Dgby_cultured_2]WDU82106.1 aldo/keto reductase [Caloramator sp. Dgby_cultured_2]
MKYRVLGKTHLKVSEIGFGGIPIQKLTQEEAAKVIHKAEETGINFIDTARAYSCSEEYIGKALKGRRKNWIIATKSMARSYEDMKRDIEISLKNLNTDYIDLYQLHNVKDIASYKEAFGENGALKALLEAKEKGIIRHIGVTSHSLDMLKHMIENPLVETIMYPYNVVERQAIETFKLAKERNIGIIAMKPMAGGVLSDGKLALKFILKDDFISTAIPGMASIQEVIENVSASKEEITKDEIELCDNIYKEMDKEFCRRCGYCAPCPQGIDIPFSFILRGYYVNYDLKDWAKERYNNLKAHASDCRECGICETRCPYDLQIRKMLKEVKNLRILGGIFVA